MAAEAWKTRFLDRLVEVDDRCRGLIQTITATLERLASPVLKANAVEGRDRIQLAAAAAREACDDLDFLLTAAGEITLLALHGGAVDPSHPLNNVLELRVRNLGHRHAVKKLLEAMDAAEVAYVIMKLFHAHLMVMGLLLDRPGFSHDVDNLINCERLVAIGLLRIHEAGLAEGCADLASGARADVHDGN
ncbi:unnamed protein product [Alopecurus aequalis]